MGLQATIEKRASKLSQSMGTADGLFWGGEYSQHTAGVAVNDKTIFGLPALYCAVKVIAESIGQLPIGLYQRGKDGTKNKIYNSLWRLLAEQPNSEQTSVEFREHMAATACYKRAAYAEIEIDKRTGEVIGLWPLPTSCVTEMVTNAGRFYKFRSPVDQREFIFESWRVLKLTGFSFTGLGAVDIVEYFAESLGLGLAMQRHSSNFFGKGAKPMVALETPNKLDTKAKDNLKSDWEKEFGGLDGKHRIAVLHQGMKLKEFALTNESSQLLESRQYQVIDVARLLRVPPHLLMDLTRATFSNIEHQGTEFVIHTLNPWLVRWEQRFKMQLMSTAEGVDHYFKFNVNALMRGDTAARQAFYTAMISAGVFSPDDVLELEDRNPQPDGIGKVYRRDKNASFVGPGAADVPQVDGAAD